jgi:hypothetical protein
MSSYDSSAAWIVLILCGSFIIFVAWLADRIRVGNLAKLRPMMHAEAEQFLANWQKHGRLPVCDSPIILEDGEVAVLSEPSNLMESRATRYYAGLGTRVGGIYVGGGQSQNVQSLKQIDSGSLTLTTRRLVFTGSLETRVVKLDDLVSVEQYADAVEIATSRRMKRQVQTVRNPLTWAAMTESLARCKPDEISAMEQVQQQPPPLPADLSESEFEELGQTKLPALMQHWYRPISDDEARKGVNLFQPRWH